MNIFITSKSYPKQIEVLVIDTGVDLSHEEIRSHVNMSKWPDDKNYSDFNSHGTHIAGIILKDTCEEVELTSCKYYGTDKPLSDTSQINCFKQALKKHYDIINFSSGGKIYIKEEYDVLKSLKDTKIIVAAGNDGENLKFTSYYPASYGLPNVIPVGNLDGKVKNSSSNYGLPNMVWMEGTRIFSFFPGGRYGIMTGSSQAAAAYSNKLLKEMCNDLKRTP